jgi:hypothetical protein
MDVSLSAFEALSFIFNNKKLAIFVVEWMNGEDGKVVGWILRLLTHLSL